MPTSHANHRQLAGLFVLLALTSACGYRTNSAGASPAARIPQDTKVIAVPAFVNQTSTYHIEQTLTASVVRELIGRTSYRVINEPGVDSDVTLRGFVTQTRSSPITYDSQTGRASSVIVTVNMRVSVVDRGGRVLYENPNFVFREQYQVSREISSFFEEESPALERLSRDFARTLVSDLMEGF